MILNRKITFFSFFILFSAFLAYSTEIIKINDKYANKIADAIFRVENSEKYPYGIKSIKIKGNTKEEREEFARRICLNTIKNQYERWQKWGKTNSFEESLANRYCPISADPIGNQRWKKNLAIIMNKY